eukprot:9477077-Pyramimonas_sp.AAC.2
MSPRGALEFECTKCKQVLSTTLLCAKCKKPGNKSAKACNSCNSSYGKLSRRWSKNPKLKSWWDAKTEDQQTQWYLDCFESNAGVEAGGELKIEVEVVEKTSDERRKLYMWKPWAQYKKELFMEGFSTQQAQLMEWRKRLQDPAYKKWFTEGEWHIGEYSGIQDSNANVREIINRQRKKISADSFEDQEDGQNRVDQMHDDYSRLASSLSAGWASGRGVGSGQPAGSDGVEASNIPDAWVKGSVDADWANAPLPDMVGAAAAELAEAREAEREREMQEDMAADSFPAAKKEVDISSAKLDLKNFVEKSKSKLSQIISTL